MLNYAGGALVQCFDHGALVGSYSHYCCGFDNAGDKYSAHWPHWALFCPHCGEIWGRRVYVYKFQYRPYLDVPWVVETAPCAQHGGGQLIPNTLTDRADEQLIRREFNLLMQQFEKESA